MRNETGTPFLYSIIQIIKYTKNIKKKLLLFKSSKYYGDTMKDTCQVQ